MVVGLLTLLLLSVVPGVGTGQETSLRVGTILPLTGPLEMFGLDMRRAVDLAASELNAAGGVLGQGITIIHEDSSTDPQTGVTAADKLISVDGAQAIIGAAATSVSVAVAGVTMAEEIVQISPSSTSPLFTTLEAREPGWFWRTAASDALQGTVAALYAYNDRSWRSVAILARDDTTGTALAQAFQDAFEGLGGTITSRIHYPITATVFSTELAAIFDSNPEAVWWAGFPGKGELILQQWWANSAWHGSSWLWSEGGKDQGFVDSLRIQGIGIEGTEGTAPIRSGPHFQAFRSAYLAQYGTEPAIFADHAYDALYLAALAAAARETVDSLSIRDSLIAVSNPPGTVVGPGPLEFARAVGILAAGGNIDYEGASGLLNFNLVGDVGSDHEIWNINATGQIQQVRVIPEGIVWPETPGTTAPTASFAVTPPSGDVTTSFNVDASGSSDPEDPLTALEVQWDWEDDGVWDTQWTDQKTAAHRYASPGTYTIRMRVRDAGTLMDSTTRQAEVAPPDTTDPTIVITSPSEGTTLTSTSVTVTGTAADDVAVDQVEVSADGTSWILAAGTTSWSVELTLSEGENAISARATDTAGNTETVSVSVTVEIPSFPVSPTVIIVSGVVVGGAAAAIAAILLRRRRG